MYCIIHIALTYYHLFFTWYLKPFIHYPLSFNLFIYLFTEEDSVFKSKIFWIFCRWNKPLYVEIFYYSASYHPKILCNSQHWRVLFLPLMSFHTESLECKALYIFKWTLTCTSLLLMIKQKIFITHLGKLQMSHISKV